MTVKLRNSLIVFLISLFIFNGLLFLTGSQKSSAEEMDSIDYISQVYVEMPSGFEVANTDVIYKINCPDVLEQIDLEEDESIKGYVTSICFEAKNGGRIYFVNGQACTIDEPVWLDGHCPTSKYSENYEVLAYDDANKNIYIKLKNLENLDDINDVAIWNGSAVEKVKYIYTENLNKKYEIKNSDFYFDVNIKTGNGFRKATNGTIFSIDLILRLRVPFEYLQANFEGITLTIIEGDNNFTLVNNFIGIEQLEKDEQNYCFCEVFAIAYNVKIEQNLTIKANMVYDGATFTAQSISSSLVALWQNVYSDINAGYINDNTRYYYDYIYLDKYYDESTDRLLPEYQDSSISKTIDQSKASHKTYCWVEIGKYINAYSSNFNTLINGCDFIALGTPIRPESSYIYKIPLEDLENANIYFLNGEPGETTSRGARLTVYKDENVFMTLFSTSSGQPYFAYDTNSYYIQNGYIYFKLNMIDTIKQQLANEGYNDEVKVYYSAVNIYGEQVDIQFNSQSISYDENVMTEMSGLKDRIDKLEKDLIKSEQLRQELTETIALLEESIANLEIAYSKLEKKYNNLSQQYIAVLTEVETLRNEKAEAIESLLAEIEAHKVTKETLEAQIAKKDGDVESLQVQLTEVNTSLTEKTQLLETTQSELTSLQNRYDELFAEYHAFIQAANGELQTISSIIHDYKITVASLEKQVADLEKQLEEEKQKNEEKKNTGGCTAGASGCSGSSGLGSSIGAGVGSTSMITAFSLILFMGGIYAKRLCRKKE